MTHPDRDQERRYEPIQPIKDDLGRLCAQLARANRLAEMLRRFVEGHSTTEVDNGPEIRFMVRLLQEKLDKVRKEFHQGIAGKDFDKATLKRLINQSTLIVGSLEMINASMLEGLRAQDS